MLLAKWNLIDDPGTNESHSPAQYGHCLSPDVADQYPRHQAVLANQLESDHLTVCSYLVTMA